MAIYYYDAQATGANDGTSKTDAYTTFAAAVTAANANGDFIYVSHTSQEELSAQALYTFTAHVNVICINFSTDAPTAMGTGGWLGTSGATGQNIQFLGAVKLRIDGLTLRVSGSSNRSITLGGSSDSHTELISCYLWSETTNAGARIYLGGSTSNCYIRLANTTLRFGNAGHSIACSARIDVIDCVLSNSGVANTSLFIDQQRSRIITIINCDFSYATNATLVDAASLGTLTVRFLNCKLPTGFTMLANTINNKGSSQVELFNCSSGNTHYHIGYADAFGTVTVDTGIYKSDHPDILSWKIATTAHCNYYTPFVTPWIQRWHTATSAITPAIEILRNDSTSALNDNDVWGEFSYQGTSGFPLGITVNDSMALLGTPAAQAAGAGLGAWTGEGGTAWSGKLAPASTITPLNPGVLMGRVFVGKASQTLYVNPSVDI